MKPLKRKLIIIFSLCAFAILMSLNITTSKSAANFSVEGFTAVACGSSGHCGAWCMGGKRSCGLNCNQE